jgi:hypothetical protein
MCEAVSGMRISRGNQRNRRKPAVVPLYPPQIPHDLTWAWTQAALVGSWQLTTWAVAWPLENVVLWAFQPYIHVLLLHSGHLCRLFSNTGRLPLWFHRGSFLENGRVTHSASTQVAGCLFALWGGDWLPQNVPALIFQGLAARNMASRASLTVSSPLRSSWIFISVSYTVGECPACFSSYVVLQYCRIGVVDQLFSGGGKLSQRLANILGSCFQLAEVYCNQVLVPKAVLKDLYDLVCSSFRNSM